jgi:TRAP-type C4-dicarboxylate transport system permease large subunit
MTEHEMGYIAKAAFPMFMIMVLMCFLLIWFPDIAMWLPDNMRQTPT